MSVATTTVRQGGLQRERETKRIEEKCTFPMVEVRQRVREPINVGLS